MAFEKKSVSLFLLFAFIGAVVGSLCGELVVRLAPDTWAARVVEIGPKLEVSSPLIWFGFKLNLVVLIFAIVGVLAFRKL